MPMNAKGVSADQINGDLEKQNGSRTIETHGDEDTHDGYTGEDDLEMNERDKSRKSSLADVSEVPNVNFTDLHTNEFQMFFFCFSVENYSEY